MTAVRLCEVEGCSKSLYATHLCKMHYLRLWRNGSLESKYNERNPSIRICSVEGCGKPFRAKGLCAVHYNFLKRNGSLEPKYIERAISKQFDFIYNVALKHESDECLTWPFSKSLDGYPIIRNYNGKSTTSASRLVCEITHGPPPTPNYDAAHECGKGHEACINPKHLSWKTRKENCADRIIHGTHPAGEKHPQAKLTNEDVEEIRMLKGQMSQRDIAEIYDISRQVISDILNGKRWKTE